MTPRPLRPSGAPAPRGSAGLVRLSAFLAGAAPAALASVAPPPKASMPRPVPAHLKRAAS